MAEKMKVVMALDDESKKRLAENPELAKFLEQFAAGMSKLTPEEIEIGLETDTLDLGGDIGIVKSKKIDVKDFDA